MKTTMTSKLNWKRIVSTLTFVALAASTIATRAADKFWTGGTASYNTLGNWGGTVPGAADSAINDNSSNNVVKLNPADPDWTVNQVRAGNGVATGAFEQNGPNLNLSGVNSNGPVVTAYVTPFRLGVAAGSTGVYTLDAGSINYSNGGFNIGELGTGILNINGGSITGSGNFAANLGVKSYPSAVTATVGGGLSMGDYTWFEQGVYAGNVSLGLPAPGSTITSVSLADHKYTLASSFTANNAVLLSTNLTTATITSTSPLVCSNLSLVGSAGNGPVIVNYTVHHADATTETGTLSIADWFGPVPNLNQEVLSVACRVDALGLTYQFPGTANGLTGNAPYLFSFDLAVTNLGSAVTSVGLTYVSGGVACLLGVSSQGAGGGDYTPLAMTGYNADIIVGVGEANYVASTVTNRVNQTNGAVNITGNGQLFIGNYGNSIYNLSGGSVDVHNYIAFGRSSGNGTLNMTGGTFNQDGGGNLLVGTGYNSNGNPAVGVLNQSGGTITSLGEFLCPENAPGNGTYNLSGSGILNIQNWFVVGRAGGAGIMNMTGGTVTKTGGGNFGVGLDNGSIGTLNQAGGSIDVNNETWIGNGGGATGTFNLGGGSLTARSWFVVGRSGSTGVLNLTNGSITKLNSGNNFIVADGATGTLNQYGGTITNTESGTWIGNGGGNGTWNIFGGTNLLGVVNIINNSGSQGKLNLNGGVMTLQELTTGFPAAVSQLTFNGGTLRATGDNANFLHDIAFVNVTGDAIFDSQNFNLTVPQPMPNNGGDNSGGLVKYGTGTLTLSGANSYAGATTVNAGKVITTTASTGNGDVSVANAAGFGVAVVGSLNSQINPGNVTFAASTATLDINLGNFGNPTLAPLNVPGTLTVGGTVTVSIADTFPQLGQFPLIQYGTKTGAGSFVLGALPTGVTASLSNNVANNSIDLVISGVNQPRWEGLAGGNWDIGLTTNWINIGTGLPTFYTAGSPVTFNDSALGSTTVNLTTTVSPSGITMTNSVLNYTFVGSGSIAGSVGLTKQGSANLSVLNKNSYTGPTVISGGTLSVTNLANGGLASALGASSANPTNLVINSGGTFQYAGTPVSVNRGYQANSGKIDAQGDFTLTGLGQTASGTLIKIGPAKMTYAGVGVNILSPANVGGSYQVNNGTVVFDGSAGTQSNRVVGEIWVGGTPASGGNLILTNTVFSVGSWLGLGRGNGTINNTSTITMYNSRATFGNVSLGYDNGIAGNLAHQFLTLNGASSITNTGDMNLCESAGSTAEIAINGTSILYGQNRFFLPNNGGATGVVMVANSGQMIVNNGWFSIGNGNDGSGSVSLKDSGRLFVSGDLNITDTGSSRATFNLQDSASASGAAVYIGKSGGSIATVTISGGSLIARTGDMQIGATGQGTVNQTGGTVIGTNWISIGRNGGGVGVYNISAGSLIKAASSPGSRFNVGEGGTGTLNVSGTANVVVGAGAFATLNIPAAGGAGTVNLNGGTITAGQVIRLGGGSGTFNFNGGMLVASPQANTAFMSGLTAANINTNGAIIDSGANVISIAQPLLDGTGGGGLTKLGAGTLYLNGTNTYTGLTVVSNGTFGGTGIIAGPVKVVSGATLSPGASIGKLTINNSLSLSNGSSTFVEVSLDGGATNDVVTGLTSVIYGGSLIVTNVGATSLAGGGSFQLFNAASPTGNFSSVTVLPAGSGSFNPLTGILTIASTAPPTVNPPKVSGGNLILTGSGGTPGAGYTWLTSTNLANPLATWTTNLQSVFDGTGSFSNSIPINVTNPAQFFRLRTP